MLPKINRIRKKRDFEAIFKRGQGGTRSFRGSFLSFKAVKNNLELARFGFVVSKKVSKKATVRNKIKRRLCVAVEGQIGNIKTGTDNLFIALPGIEKKEFFEIKETVKKCLEQ